MGGYCTNPMFLLVDNSDSPSVVEQLQQGCDSGCYTLLAVISSSMKCLMPYACQLASCSMGISYYAFCSCSYVLIFPVFFSSLVLFLHFLSPNWGSAAPFIQGVFSLNLGIACLTMCTLGYHVWLSKPLIGQVHSGVACLVL